jgi:hypothetical protein
MEIDDSAILNSEQIPSLLGLVVLQPSCNLELNFRFIPYVPRGRRSATFRC